MKKSSRQKLQVICFLICYILTSFSFVFGQNKSQKTIDEFSRRAKQSAKTLDNFAGAGDGIPKEVLQSAKAIAVFPRVTRFKWFLGRTHGKGVVSRKTDFGWSAPVSFEIESDVSVGFGYKYSTIVLVFMEDEATQKLKQPKVNLGKELNLVLGPRKSLASDGEIPSGQVFAYEEVYQKFLLNSGLSGATLKARDEETKAINCGFGVVESLFPQDTKPQICSKKNEGSNKLMQTTDSFQQPIANSNCVCDDVQFANRPKKMNFYEQTYPTKVSDINTVFENLKDILNSEDVGYPTSGDGIIETYSKEEDSDPDNGDTCLFGQRKLSIRFRFDVFSANDNKIYVKVLTIICSKGSRPNVTTLERECDNNSEVTSYLKCGNSFRNRIIDKIKAL